MIPWFQIQAVGIWFVKLNVWGMFVSFGFLAGMAVSYFEFKKRKLEANRVYDLAFWIILCSMIGGRLFFVAEHLDVYLAAPLDILKLWHGGMSIYGGFIGAVLAGIIYFKKSKLDFWQYADAAIFGLPFGLFIGRLGCFLIHDHPGVRTNFFLGVAYPDGIRHDLGLYDSLAGLFIFLVFLILHRKEWFRGFYLSVFCVLYGAIRFFLDFFRVRDAVGADLRYFGLTLAQYLSVALFVAGIYLFCKLRAKKQQVISNF